MNISTINTKQQQLANTYFSVGSGPTVILVMGSCRSVPYMNYLNEWNEQNDQPFTINFIDPFNWNWDQDDERINYEEKLAELEKDERLLSMIRSVDIFVHEFYANAGMFNCNKNTGKSIYDFGIDPLKDICIPNFNNIFILFGDIVSFDIPIRQMAIADYNVSGKLSDKTIKEICKMRDENIQKFYDICLKSDVPEMIDYFAANRKTKRLFWTHNHVSKYFTLAIFRFINQSFLHLKFTEEYLEKISKDDMFANNYTHQSEYDGYIWGEEIVPLKHKL